MGAYPHIRLIDDREGQQFTAVLARPPRDGGLD
jgi:hypothetical protein